MLELKQRFQSARVLVVGDLMLDEYIIGAVSRISPEAPVPVLDVRSRYQSAGGAANVAMNIASLGATVFLVGIVGRDTAGSQLRHLLESHGISTACLIESPDRATISKTRIVAGQQQICRIDHEQRSPISSTLLTPLLESFSRALPESDIIVLSDYAKGTLTDACCQQLISLAASKPVIVDPKSADFRKYLGCTLITPNQHEASIASGIAIESGESLTQAGDALLDRLPGASILITRGPEGMSLFEPNSHAPLTIPTLARQVFDVVGAGDTVVATLSVALAAQVPLHEAIHFANLAAGIVVEKPGTATLTFDELALCHLPRP